MGHAVGYLNRERIGGCRLIIQLAAVIHRDLPGFAVNGKRIICITRGDAVSQDIRISVYCCHHPGRNAGRAVLIHGKGLIPGHRRLIGNLLIHVVNIHRDRDCDGIRTVRYMNRKRITCRCLIIQLAAVTDCDIPGLAVNDKHIIYIACCDAVGQRV